MIEHYCIGEDQKTRRLPRGVESLAHQVLQSVRSKDRQPFVSDRGDEIERSVLGYREHFQEYLGSYSVENQGEA